MKQTITITILAITVLASCAKDAGPGNITQTPETDTPHVHMPHAYAHFTKDLSKAWNWGRYSTLSYKARYDSSANHYVDTTIYEYYTDTIVAIELVNDTTVNFLSCDYTYSEVDTVNHIITYLYDAVPQNPSYATISYNYVLDSAYSESKTWLTGSGGFSILNYFSK